MTFTPGPWWKSHDGYINAGSYEWRNMRAAGDAAREVLRRIDGQEEPR